MERAEDDAGRVADGLSSDEAARRLREIGPNELQRARPASRIRVFARQLASPFSALLLGAAVLALIVEGPIDAGAIAAILLLNAIVGFVQESRAERALAALRSMTAPRATVVRDGARRIVPASSIVPGDRLVLEPGDVVAADGVLLEAHSLRTSEASLTGESAPVAKSAGAPLPAVPLAEQVHRVFMGTHVAAGTGVALVDATGSRTEMGRVAALLGEASSGPTPLQQRLARVGRLLVGACLGIVALVFALRVLRGEEMSAALLSAVALAVAAVPEGLPAVVTIALAVGVERLASRNVLVRRLPSVETLGATTVICTDKTGTLTTGVMTLRDTWGADRKLLLETAAACVDAELAEDGRSAIGDPTEIAILVAARADGITRAAIEASAPRVRERPFDPSTRSMAVARADGRVRVKGAFEAIAPLCAVVPGGAASAASELARRGLRVLAVAVGAGSEERDLEMVGLLGLADPPRTEAIEAVAVARSAGIRTVMITGDHASTARAIAEEMGLVRDGDDATRIVHARATPEDKLRIVRDWKSQGAIVAMTGDGVNDAPALREAHVGIAMGKTGTEVTREASDMVLADDDYASIVAGIREGRGVQANIRKTLAYLLAGNTGEMLLMVFAAIAGLPIPLLPLHLLWINLVTDGLPALALVADPADESLMKKPPQDPREPMLRGRDWRAIGAMGLLEASLVLGVFAWALPRRGLADARDLAFSALVMSELFRAFSSRDAERLFWESRPLSNLRLLGVIVGSALLQVLIHDMAFTRELFKLGDLSLLDCALVVMIGLIPVSIAEVSKLVRR